MPDRATCPGWVTSLGDLRNLRHLASAGAACFAREKASRRSVCPAHARLSARTSITERAIAQHSRFTPRTTRHACKARPAGSPGATKAWPTLRRDGGISKVRVITCRLRRSALRGTHDRQASCDLGPTTRGSTPSGGCVTRLWCRTDSPCNRYIRISQAPPADSSYQMPGTRRYLTSLANSPYPGSSARKVRSSNDVRMIMRPAAANPANTAHHEPKSRGPPTD
jgi:hypothetical protein